MATNIISNMHEHGYLKCFTLRQALCQIHIVFDFISGRVFEYLNCIEIRAYLCLTENIVFIFAPCRAVAARENVCRFVLIVNTTDNVSPFHSDFERQSLRATASVQTSLGVPVIIHPGRHHASPAEVVRVLQEAGGDLSRTVMSHLDRRWLFNPCADFILRSTNRYLHFLSFINTAMAQVLGILPHGRPVDNSNSLLLLLMWRRKEQGHRPLLNWPCSPRILQCPQQTNQCSFEFHSVLM